MDKPNDGVEVKTYVEKIDKLIANELNPRTINRKAYESLKKSLKDFPEMKQLREIVVDENLTILGGHQRIHALKELGYSDVTVKQVFGLTEKQKREFIIKDNTASGEWDTDIIANQWDVEELENWGVPKFELGLIEPGPDAKEDDFDATPPSEPQTVLGDLYEIGEHRLLCGDSTDTDHVEKLMNGEKADMVFTDPPYNILDHKIETGINPQEIFSIYNIFLKDNTFVVFFGQHPTIVDFINGANNNGFNYVNEIIWNKKTTSNAFSDVLRVHENMMIYKKGVPKYYNTKITFDEWLKEADYDKLASLKRELSDARQKDKPKYRRAKSLPTDEYYSGMSKSNYRVSSLGRDEKGVCTVWNEFRDSFKSRNNGESLHVTQKPVNLLSRALKLCSTDDNLIMELFLGSGSTMVAAHQINRKCYGMELDPKYCDVIVTRMLKLDPSLIIKRNGEVIEWQTVAIGED